jgi:hypothetical protein
VWAVGRVLGDHKVDAQHYNHYNMEAEGVSF